MEELIAQMTLRCHGLVVIYHMKDKTGEAIGMHTRFATRSNAEAIGMLDLAKARVTDMILDQGDDK